MVTIDRDKTLALQLGTHMQATGRAKIVFPGNAMRRNAYKRACICALYTRSYLSKNNEHLSTHFLHYPTGSALEIQKMLLLSFDYTVTCTDFIPLVQLRIRYRSLLLNSRAFHLDTSTWQSVLLKKKYVKVNSTAKAALIMRSLLSKFHKVSLCSTTLISLTT